MAKNYISMAWRIQLKIWFDSLWNEKMKFSMSSLILILTVYWSQLMWQKYIKPCYNDKTKTNVDIKKNIFCVFWRKDVFENNLTIMATSDRQIGNRFSKNFLFLKYIYPVVVYLIIVLFSTNNVMVSSYWLIYQMYIVFCIRICRINFLWNAFSSSLKM